MAKTPKPQNPKTPWVCFDHLFVCQWIIQNVNWLYHHPCLYWILIFSTSGEQTFEACRRVIFQIKFLDCYLFRIRDRLLGQIFERSLSTVYAFIKCERSCVSTSFCKLWRFWQNFGVNWLLGYKWFKTASSFLKKLPVMILLCWLVEPFTTCLVPRLNALGILVFLRLFFWALYIHLQLLFLFIF